MKYREVIKCIDEEMKAVADKDDIKTCLNAAFIGLQKSIKKSSGANLQSKSASIEKLCIGLINIVDLINCNRRKEAYQTLFDLYFKDENRNRLRLYMVSADTCFYKMRSADSFTQYLIEEGEKGMYHIPFELRHKIGNDRYGISGFPIFYLSFSTYGCWEELNRPNLEFANVALFKSTKDMSFLDMVPPSNEETITNISIQSLPLILASRLKRMHPNGNYIQEYSIPQLLMECLIGSRIDGKIDDKTLIGIRYESIHKNDAGLLFTDVDKDDIFVNYAIPPFKPMEKGICPEIVNLFYLWNSTSWAEMTYKDSSWCLARKAKTHYEESKFGIIENYLKIHDRGMQTFHTRRKGGISVGASIY